KDVIVEENRVVDDENQVIDETVVDLRSERKFTHCSRLETNVMRKDDDGRMRERLLEVKVK
nr:hypothetical protein [Tanacetum cinerariifolium]